MTVSLYGAIESDGELVPAYDLTFALRTRGWQNGRDVSNENYIEELDIDFNQGNYYHIFEDTLGYDVVSGKHLEGQIQDLQDRATEKLIRAVLDKYTVGKLKSILAFCLKAKELGATHFYGA